MSRRKLQRNGAPFNRKDFSRRERRDHRDWEKREKRASRDGKPQATGPGLFRGATMDQPEGLQLVSPGQRPGNRDRDTIRALKGRQLDSSAPEPFLICRPFRA